MFGGGMDDEEGDFGSSLSSGSKLGSLFGMDRANTQDGNQSLQYTAPKQPKKGKTSSKSGGGSGTEGSQAQVLHAVAVHAFRYTNSQYVKQGKLGAAILGYHGIADYKLLLYVSKQQQVTHAKISPNFTFTVQANNYATFYDEQRQNWSLMFDSEDSAFEFSKQIGLAKFNSSGGSANNVVYQELRLGQGPTLQEGDSVEVKYTGWLLENKAIGTAFDSNMTMDKAFRFKIGKGKVIKGWDQGVIGMKKGGKRLLVVPSNMAYGSRGMGSRIPPNATLIFEIEIRKIKFGRERDDTGSLSSASESIDPPMRALPDEPIGLSIPNNNDMKMQSNSSDHLSTSPGPNKAKLISRMAKMGQPMLPLSSTPGQDSTDSDVEEHSPAEMTGHTSHIVNKRPARAPKPVPRNGHMPDPNQLSHGQQTNLSNQSQQMHGIHPHQQQIAIYQSRPQVQQQQQPQQPSQQPPQTQPPPYGYMQVPTVPKSEPAVNYPQVSTGYNYQGQPQQTQPNLVQPGQFNTGVYPQPSMVPSDLQSPAIITETRQCHSDMKLAIGMVSEKIDRLSSKLDHINTDRFKKELESSVPHMEGNILMQNIQRIVQENERLQKELYDKNSKIEIQNDKISELLQRNQKYVEQSNSLLEQRNDSFKQSSHQSQSRVLELEQEKTQMTTELSNSTAKVSKLQLEVASCQQKESQLRQHLITMRHTSDDLKNELESCKAQTIGDEAKIKELSKVIKDDKQLRKQLENRIGGLEEELADLKSERDTLQKHLSDRKKKAVLDKQKTEEEFDELKKMHEKISRAYRKEEIDSLKSKLRQQKTSKDVATVEQISQVEKEMEKQWRDKCDRLLLQAQEKHDRMYSDLKEEREELEKRLVATEHKLAILKSSQGDDAQQIEQLKEQVDEMRIWKDKYNSLHGNAMSMKERYESRIRELMQDLERSMSNKPHGSVVEEVKKIMNSVFYSLREEFEEERTYKGTEVLSTIMSTIKAVTMKLVKGEPDNEAESDEDDEEESSEGEDEVDEDDEEENESSAGIQKSYTESVSAQKEEATPVGTASGQLQQVPAPPEETECSINMPGLSEALADLEIRQRKEEEAGEVYERVTKVKKPDADSAVTRQPSTPPPSADEESDDENTSPVEPKVNTISETMPELPEITEEEEEEEEEEEGEVDEKIAKEVEATDEKASEQPTVPSTESPNLDDLPDQLPDISTAEDGLEASEPDKDLSPIETPPELPPESPPQDSPDSPPELPPELPPDDEKPTKAANSIFDDDEDDDSDLFTAVPAKKKIQKKPVLDNNDDDDDPRKPPPPLFGGADDEDDLDWLNT
ncbi:FK506-binding protein 15-like isoform X4 [Anneissia japonica]|uniref:FK506-binding protein 15-like isoform X4 n=1 Tax=Anneissia japonica TaxID=1529436 RepID=UPI0014256AC4|nr:FK506-binding protein 15-like isoform X4 [Anneissia japonica]